jgi:PAS domain S-box-containing protein
MNERMTATDERDLYRVILDTVEHAVAAADTDGCIIFWNRQAQRLYGWRAHEVMGMNLTDLTVVDAPRGPRFAGQAVLKRRDETTFIAWLNRTPILDAHGAVTGRVEVAADMDAVR